MRRSSAKYKYLLLPLDLHVLGLPLAFILSQDQTLHRLILNNFKQQVTINSKSDQSHCTQGILNLVYSIQQKEVSLFMSTLSIQYINELIIRIFLPTRPRVFIVTRSFSGCKYITVFNSCNTFQKLI